MALTYDSLLNPCMLHPTSPKILVVNVVPISTESYYRKNTCSTPNIQPPLPRNFGEKTIDTLRELVFLRRISCFLVGRNHSSQIGDINHNIQKFGSCLTMFNYTFHNRYYQYYIKRFWGYVFPGTKYTYLERKCPLVLMGKGLLLEGSTPKIEDKQVPGL